MTELLQFLVVPPSKEVSWLLRLPNALFGL